MERSGSARSARSRSVRSASRRAPKRRSVSSAKKIRNAKSARWDRPGTVPVMADEDRRKFLKVATCAIGGGVGLAVAAPVLTLLADPAGKGTVTTPTSPLDLGLAERFRAGVEPKRVDIVAPVVKDGWTAARNVV